ncbi:hypothetical protein ACOME3_003298 [Neoechinorhynchus agilis]
MFFPLLFIMLVPAVIPFGGKMSDEIAELLKPPKDHIEVLCQQILYFKENKIPIKHITKYIPFFLQTGGEKGMKKANALWKEAFRRLDIPWKGDFA